MDEVKAECESICEKIIVDKVKPTIARVEESRRELNSFADRVASLPKSSRGAAKEMMAKLEDRVNFIEAELQTTLRELHSTIADTFAKASQMGNEARDITDEIFEKSCQRHGVAHAVQNKQTRGLNTDLGFGKGLAKTRKKAKR